MFGSAEPSKTFKPSPPVAPVQLAQDALNIYAATVTTTYTAA